MNIDKPPPFGKEALLWTLGNAVAALVWWTVWAACTKLFGVAP